MLFSLAATVLLGSSGALALARHECYLQNSKDLAEYSDCGHHGSLTHCLSSLDSFDVSDLQKCYVNAGCSAAEAAIEASYTQDRCDKLSKLGELKKRSRGNVHQAAQTIAVRVAGNKDEAPLPTVVARAEKLQCKITKKVKTKTCPLQTQGNKVKTLSCFTTEVARATCAPGLKCALDADGKDICMKLQDNLEIGGIIISIVFGVGILAGISFLTFQCCRESREHKRIAARAEATALARAATKKQRTQDARAPLMRQQEGSTDPFHDRNHS